MRRFKALNIHCQNCANTIKNYLEDDFGDVEVDVQNGVVNLKIDDENVENFKNSMKEIGFEIEKEI
ncbi:heavy metal transport/detoxification protein [Campylobacter sp. FMV-PI01]|uniref:Heavy metal transport/detoxification protein n=1 Tax=Campylobacter portucalensis TaxID=2608384 RepID=A0A6L5WM22_9BACT|nr:cation transporter [Campylobacter portucalensis]MSN97045.1 heavy metal transport/detoxification protein [Campylobacter portucalensis]